MLSNIMVQRVVYQTIMRIIQEVRISEDQTIRATVNCLCALHQHPKLYYPVQSTGRNY